MRVKMWSILALCVFLSGPPVRPSEAEAEAAAPRCQGSGGRSSSGSHEQEGAEGPGGVADPIRQALWVSPGLQEPPVLAVLVLCSPVRVPWEGGRGAISVLRPRRVPVPALSFTGLIYNLCLLVFGPGS